MIKIFSMVLMLTSCGVSSGVSNETTMSINDVAAPKDIWVQYIESSPEAARSFVEPRFFASIYNGLPPKTELVRALKVDSTDEFDQYAKLNLSIELGGDTFRNWLAFKKNGAGMWQLTLDEVPVLNELTKAWLITKIGKINYHTSADFPEEWRPEAEKLNATYDVYAKQFGYQPGIIDYYAARSPEEADQVVGEKDRGSGQARYKAIKAYDTPSHKHELVHVFAFELGAINPFFDEGLATSLGNNSLLTSKPVCDDVKSLLKDGVETYLDATKFRTAQRQHRNVYALAQQVVSYWIAQHGFDKIKNSLREGTKQPFSVNTILADHFGSFSNTTLQVTAKVNEICTRYKQ